MLLMFGLTLRAKFNPLTVAGSMWLLVAASHLLSGGRYDSIELEAEMLLSGFILLFGIFCWMAYIMTPAGQSAPQQVLPFNRLRLAALTTVLLTPAFLLRLLSIARSGPTGNMLINLRYQTSVSGMEMGVLQYALPFALVTMAVLGIAYYSGQTRLRWWFRVVLLCTFVMHAALLARAQMIAVIMVYFVVAYAFKRLTRRRLLVALLAMTGAFFAITTGLNKSSSTVGQTITDYFAPPVVALGQVMQKGENPDLAVPMLSSVGRILGLLGFDLPTKSLILPFTTTPVPTNLYTTIMPYYALGGPLLVLVLACLLGILHGVLWRKAQLGRPVWLIVYAASFIALTGQFGGETYLSLLSFWVQIGFWALIFFRPVRTTSRQFATRTRAIT